MNKLSTALAIAAVSSAALATDGTLGVGFRSVEGVHVASGSTTFTSNIIEGAEGKFYKTGAGTLQVPLANVNRQADWNLAALGGILRLSVGDDATVDVANPPAILQKATLWLDQSSVITTNGVSPWYEGTSALCAKWVDVRDRENPDNPQHIYAMPAWTAHTAASYSEYMGVPPAQVTEEGRQALFFYGPKSVHLVLSAKITNVCQFVVHGIRTSNGAWGPVIGSTEKRSGGYLIQTSSSGVILLANATAHFAKRLDCTESYAHSRNFLDGVLFDPFSVKPKNTFQLLETQFCNNKHIFDRIFYNMFDGFKDTTPQGGDYVCEIIAFADPISETDRLEVERYLMKKWSLPAVAADTDTTIRYPAKTGELGAAKDATVRVDTVSGAETPAVSFAGEGILLKEAAGALIIGHGGPVESSGRLQINGGHVIVRNGRTPAQRAQAGCRYTSAAVNDGSTRAADVDAAAGERLTRAYLNDGTVGRVEKQGDSWVRFNEIDPSVKQIDILNGTLQIESKPFVTNYLAGSAEIEATVPNADFEMPYAAPTLGNGRSPLSNTPANGWTGTAYYNAWTDTVHHAQTYFGEVGTTRVRPLGNQVLHINQSTYGQATITIPQDGRYMFECVAKGRYEANYSSTLVNFITLSVGADETSLAPFGELHATGRRFTRYRFKMPHLTAGTYVLRLQGTLNGVTSGTLDGATHIDSVRIVRESETDDVAFKIPNGDFESFDKAAAQPYYAAGSTLENVPTGWTLAVTNSKFTAFLENTLLGPISPIFQHTYDTALYDEFAERPGCKALSMRLTGSYARTSFTAPAGTFRLRANIGFHPMNFTPKGGSETAAQPYNGSVAATITLADGTVVNLGNVVASSVLAAPTTWNTAFTIPEAQTVTLELRQTVNAASAIVDDLVLVEDRRAVQSENLIANGDAEFATPTGTGWTVGGDTSFWKYSSSGTALYSTKNTHYYGYCAFEGLRTFSFQCAGFMYRTISVPEAGTYRFTCHSRTRADSNEYAGNGIQFWMTKPGSGVTNFHNTLLMPYCRNFLERSWLVDIPEAGDWIFGMKGTGVAGTTVNADRLSYLDGLSLVRAEARADVPEMPEKTRINIAAGARLVLDFPGTVTVRRLTLGGKSVGGTVSAATHPDYIGGIGSLQVVPDHTIIIIK